MQIEFSGQILEDAQISNSMKIHPVGAEFFYADGQADMKKLIASFHSFANAPEAGLILKSCWPIFRFPAYRKLEKGQDIRSSELLRSVHL